MDLGGGSLKSLKEGKLKIHVVRHGGVKPVENLSLTFGDAVGDFYIYVAGDDSSVVVSSGVKGGFNIRLWRASSVFIGEKTTSNNAKIVCDNSTFECGSDCMFSDGVIFQTADQHAIIDLRSKKIINLNRSRVKIGSHVWVGRNATLMPGAVVGSGSIVALGSIVTKEFKDNVAIAGIPAYIVKEDVSWSRNPGKVDSYCMSQYQDEA